MGAAAIGSAVGGLASGLKGGKGGDSGPQTLSLLSGAQQGALDQNLIPFLNERLRQKEERFNFNDFGSQLTDQQQFSLNTLEDLTRQQLNLPPPELTQTEKEGDRALRGILNAAPGSQQFENFAQAAITDPVLRDLEQNDILTARRRAGTGSVFGTDRAFEEGRNRENAIGQIAQGRANLAQQQQGNILQAAQLLPTLANQRDLQNRFGQQNLQNQQSLINNLFGLGEQNRRASLDEFTRIGQDATNNRINQLLQASTAITQGIAPGGGGGGGGGKGGKGGGGGGGKGKIIG